MDSTANRAADPAPASISTNSFWLFAAQLGSKVIGLASIVAVTRGLGVDRYGQFALAAAFAGFFAPFLDLGMDPPATRRAALEPERAGALLGGSLAAKSALTLVALPAAVLGAMVMGYAPPVILLVGCAVLATWAASLAGSFLAVFRAWRRMDLEAWASLGLRLATLALTLAALAAGAGVLGVGVAQIAGGVAGVGLAALVAARRGLRAEWPAALARARELAREGVPFALTALLVTVYFRIDTLMLEAFRDTRSVGLFNAAVSLMFSAMIVSTAMVTAVFPVVAGSGGLNDPIARRVFGRALTASLALGLPIGACLAAGAPFVLELLYGPEYLPAAGALALLAASLPVLFLTSLMGHVLGASGRQRVVLGVAIANAVINVGLNLWLIPRYHLEGAALATLATELAGLTVFCAVLRRELAATMDRPALVAVLGSVLALGATLLVTRGWHPVASVASALAVYGVLLAAASRLPAVGPGLPGLDRLAPIAPGRKPR